MKKNTLKTDLILFLLFFGIISLVYYFFNREEIVKTKNYDFLIYSFLGASSIVVVPLIQRLFKKKK